MEIVKNTILTILFISSSYVGILISKKYKNRVTELKELKTYINMLLTKIKMTYEPIPQIFEEIGNKRE